MKYERTFTADEEAILNNDLLDIKDWIDKAIQGKIENCKKRAAISLREILKKEGVALVPSDDTVAAKQLFSREGYKNRTDRDAE